MKLGIYSTIQATQSDFVSNDRTNLLSETVVIQGFVLEYLS